MYHNSEKSFTILAYAFHALAIYLTCNVSMVINDIRKLTRPYNQVGYLLFYTCKVRQVYAYSTLLNDYL